jgi:hypothetical protein
MWAKNFLFVCIVAGNIAVGIQPIITIMTAANRGE